MATTPRCQFHPHVLPPGTPDMYYTQGTCVVKAGVPVKFDFNPGNDPATISGPKAPTTTYTKPSCVKVTFDSPGTYTWTITNGLGSATDTVTVTE